MPSGSNWRTASAANAMNAVTRRGRLLPLADTVRYVTEFSAESESLRNAVFGAAR